MNAIEQNIFFELLRSSLWGTKVNYEEWPKGWDWLPILKTVKGQALVTLMLEPILALPENLQPDGATIENYSKQMGANMLRHGSLNKDLNEILRLLESKGFRPVLLKGQGNSTFYPKPLLRKCGDLDIYVGLDRFEEACAVLRSWKPMVCKVGYCSELHADFKFDKTEVELHRYVNIVRSPYSNSAFQQIAARELVRTDLVDVSGCKVDILPAQMNGLYLFAHLWGHLRVGGVGLRQFSDLAVVLHQTHRRINVDVLKSDLKRMRMLQEWILVGNILVNYLGLPSSEFPLYKTVKTSVLNNFMNLVLVDGNFGSNRRELAGPGSFNNLKRQVRRCSQLASFSPKLSFKLLYGRLMQSIENSLKSKS